MENLKMCSKCRQLKPLSEFHKDKNSSTGYRSDCKECRSKKYRKPKEQYLPNVTREQKICVICNKLYQPNSNRQLYCPDCKKELRKQKCKYYYRRTYKPKGRSHLKREKANIYKNGIGIYQIIKKETVEELKCERCGSIKNLLVHHKDRDRTNNDISNLELLCKSCHQKEHLIRDEKGRFKGSI